MSYALGVDIGTTFVTTAMARPGDGDEVVSDALACTRELSVVLVEDSGGLLFGDDAEQRGMTRPERLVRGFTRRIGDAVPIAVGNTRIMPERVFALVARRAVDRAEQREGRSPGTVALSVPAGWGEYRTGLVRRALAEVGLADASLVSEPQAAATYHAITIPIDTDAAIAVYDLSAGRFDVALLRKTDGTGFDLLATDSIERVGGGRFDDAVVRHVARENLTDLDDRDPATMQALVMLRRECIRAKEILSSETGVTISVVLPASELHVRLERSTFEQMIEETVHRSIDVVRGAMRVAGVDGLSGIRLVGGSSRIPLVARLVSEELNAPIAVRSDPEFSVALGAAIGAVASIDPDDQQDDPGISRRERATWFKRGASGGSAAVRRGASVLVTAITAVAGTQLGPDGLDRTTESDQPGPVG